MKLFLSLLMIPPLMLVLAHIPYESKTYFEDGHVSGHVTFRGGKKNGWQETYYHNDYHESHSQSYEIQSEALYQNDILVGDIVLFTPVARVSYTDQEGDLAESLWRQYQSTTCGNDQQNIYMDARHGKNWETLNGLKKSKIIALEAIINTYGIISFLSEIGRSDELTDAEESQLWEIRPVAQRAKDILLFKRQKDYPRFTVAQLSYMNKFREHTIDIEKAVGLELVI